MHDFRRLEIWEKSLAIAESIYRVTASLPKQEAFGLTAQLRRAGVSIGSNIAEGAGRGTPKEMARFLRNALGSIAEIETQLELAIRLGLIGPETELLSELNNLRRRVITLHDHVLESD